MSSLIRLYSSSSRTWLQRHRNDYYVKKSIQEKTRSRGGYKLMQLNQSSHIITSRDIVIDLGAAPGGWSLVASRIIDPNRGGYVCAVDLLPFKDIPNVSRIEGDFRADSTIKQLHAILKGKKADVVLSDMLHNTTGQRSIDHIRSIELVLGALDFCEGMLKTDGKFLAKFLRGGDEEEMFERARELFVSHKVLKPKASRSESSEVYILCTGKK
mmetsp:Transcript_24761/g.36522  ORF Transcript_24761/g.36522 Transcript_24761/m.36522 type:complete len:213 (+) Transcript_24761:79-717(+)